MKSARYIFAVLATVFLVGSVLSAGIAFSAEETENDMESRILVDNEDIDTEFLQQESEYDILAEYDSFSLVETSEEGLNSIQEFDHAVEELNNKDLVSLQSHTFHTSEGEPELSETLTVDSESTQSYHIVQLIGPTKPEWREELQQIGAELHGSRQRFNYIVEMDTETREKVEELDFVNWVGDYHPAYSFDEELMDEEGTSLLDVQIFDGTNTDMIASEISQTGAEIKSVVRNTITVEIESENIDELASISGVNSITEGVEEYELFNSDATWVAQTNEQDNRKVTDEGITGEDEIVTVMDSGLYEDHEAFSREGKLIDNYVPPGADGDTDEGHDHGTHVSGTVLGESPPYEEYSNEDGNALEADLVHQDTSTDGRGMNPPTDMYSDGYGGYYDEGSRVHTNSWGGGSGEYGDDAQTADEFIWDHKDFNILYAMGNDGDGADSLSVQAEGKNIFSVGSLDNAPNQDDVSGFSSRGYAEDGRIKPTILHVGENLMSAGTGGPEDYTSMQGTSMSTPGIAGQVAQVRQYYEDGFHTTGTENPEDGFNPSNALVRATLINSAVEVSGSGAYNNDNRFPNNDQGFGRSQLDRAMYFEGDDRNVEVFDSWDEGLELDTGESWDMELEVEDPSEELEVTLAWTDPPSDQGADPTIVNDLDLEVEAPDGTRYVGNAFEGYNPGYSEPNPTSNPWDGPRNSEYDGLNVEENVLLLPDENGVESGTYEVTVTAHDVPEESQPFAVVASGGIGDEPIPDEPEADFTYDQIEPTEEYTVEFTDESVPGDYDITEWYWEFGDGETSTEQHPTHSYTEEGTYTVELTVTDQNDISDSVSEEVVVEDEPVDPPTAEFEFVPESPEEGESVEFSDESTEGDANIVDWSWDFGDGATSSDENPTHVYDEEGTYTVELTVTDENDLSDTTTDQIEVEEDDEYDEFTATNSEHEDAGRAYSEFDWGEWGYVYYAHGSGDYLGGSGDVTTLREIEPGEYYELVEDEDPEGPDAEFTFTPEEPEVEETVDFTDQSTEGDESIVSWSWDFGDGATSGDENPTHVYDEEGTYTVELTVTDENDLSDTTTDQIEAEDDDDDEYEEYTASNSEHEDTGRAYSEGWWNPEYYAVGSGDYLGGSGDVTTLREIEPGEYYELVDDDDDDDDEYCEVEGGDTSHGEYITNVQFNGIDVDSGDEGGYADYTEHVSDPIIPGEQYLLSVTLSTGGFENYVSVVIDWGQDYDLTNEDIYGLGSGDDDPLTLSAYLEVPEDAELGETRMRIMQEYGDYHTEPCEDQDYGETHDFTVEIGESTAFVVEDKIEEPQDYKHTHYEERKRLLIDQQAYDHID